MAIQMRENIINELAQDGYILDPEAERFVLAQSDPRGFARGCLERMDSRPLIITMADLRKVCIVDVDQQARLNPSKAEMMNTGPKEYSGGDIVVLKDITGMTDCNASVEGFATYFQDRFNTLKGLLLKRRDLVGTATIEKALDSNRLMVEKEVKVIGMVNDVRECRNGRIVELEDETGKIVVMVPEESRLANESILQDEVLGIIGKPTSRDKKLIATALIRPDVPHGSGMERRDNSSIIGFMSDVHIGSNTFLHRQWEEMIDFVKQEAPDLGLQYLVIPGDCVDGIGIYPNQEEELELDDIFDQYHALAEIVKEIPDYIKVVVQPGNHDAVRLAEPQPAFAGEIAKLFDSSTILIGNPCYLNVEGRTILTYHGKSFDDLMASVKGLSYSNPIGAMKEMLKRRHLATVYGGRTPLAPEKKDFLVIDKVPDIFVTGHVHGAGVDHYNGVRLINASTWQAQTSFQKMHNFNPDPAKLIMVHLGTGQTHTEDFNS